MPDNLPLPPKPPVPSTNLLPAIVIIAVVAALCLALAFVLPAPRRPTTTETPPSVKVIDILPVPSPTTLPPPSAPLPITEYEDTSRATLPTPTTPPVEEPSPSQVPDLRASAPRWVTNAAPAPAASGPRLALVIDDMGVDEAATRQAMAQLPPAVAFSFLPYAPASHALAKLSKEQGHDILIHIPMEPLPRADAPNPGPRALRVEDDEPTRAANLASNVDALKDLAVGANNHMGSRFTQWPEGMRQVLSRLDAEQLFFLDSVTTAHTATKAAAQGLPLPLLRRDVFLDDTPEPAAIRAELDKALATAQRKGEAIAIGHPHPATLAALAGWLPTVSGTDVTLVPISSLIPRP